MNSSYKCKNCNHIFDVDLIPKRDRGSDTPEVNDYSQGYFFGPQDLGRVHQHSPADTGYLPAGTEDMDGPSSNVMMSSLDKKADSEGYWIQPNGEIIDVTDTTHDEWLLENRKFDDLPESVEDAIQHDWIRVMTISGQASFNIHDLNNPPKILNDLAYHFTTKRWIVADTTGAFVIIDEPKKSFSEEVKLAWAKKQRQPIMSSFSKFMQKQSSLNKSAITKNYALYIGNVLMTRTMTRWKAEKILKERFPEQYKSGNYSILEEEYKTGSLQIKSHCGPCSAIKADVLRMLSDLKYKDNSVSDDILCEMAKLSAEESNKAFADKLKVVYESLPKEHEAEANKLKNHYLALIDIQEKLDNGEMKADKPLSKKEAAKDIPVLSNKVVTELIPMFVDKVDPPDHKCKTCKFRIEKDGKSICAVMKGDINLEKGTCNYWAEGEASKEQNPSQMERKTAGYIEANTVNCESCKHFKDNYCSLWNGKVQAAQCCMAWEGSTFKEGSLDKEARTPTRLWVDPNGKEFEVSSGGHGAWIKTNKDLLTQYGLNTSTVGYTWPDMISKGWTRIATEWEGSGDKFGLEVADLRNLPSYADSLISKYYVKGKDVELGDMKGRLVNVSDPFPSIQKAVNRELSRTKQASLDIPQETQNQIASQYGPEILVGLRFYSDALSYGQPSDRALSYAMEEMKNMGFDISEEKFLEVFNQYKS